MVRIRLSLALAATLLFPPYVLGHDTWLAPDPSRADRPVPVTLSLTSGMEFPKLDHAVKSSRVAAARWRTSAGTGEIETIRDGANALELHVGKVPDGVASFWVILHPFPSELKREQVQEYVGHLGLDDPGKVLQSWQEQGEPGVKYRYTKFAKTFVRIGGSNVSAQWREAAGMPLELVPQNDPTTIPAGGAITFLLLREGQPLSRYPVSLVRESMSSAATTHTTDAEGRVQLQLPAAGRYMVRATTLEQSKAPDTNWDVRFTTVTIETARQMVAKE